MQKQFNAMMQKRMDRKDFLKHVAMGFVVITGVAGVAKLLQPQQQTQPKPAVAMGYGASVYGGHSAKS